MSRSNWSNEQGAAFNAVFDQLCEVTGEPFPFGEDGEERRRDKAKAYWRVLAKFEPQIVIDAGRKLAASCRRMPPAADWVGAARSLERAKHGRRAVQDERTWAATTCSLCNDLGYELYQPAPVGGVAQAPAVRCEGDPPRPKRCECPDSARVPNPKASREYVNRVLGPVFDRIAKQRGKRPPSTFTSAADIAAGKQPALEPCSNCGTPADLDAGLCFRCIAQQQEAR